MNKSLIQQTPTPPPDKLAYSWLEVCKLLGIGRVSVWRLEKRGFIKPVPGLKAVYTGTSVRALCAGQVEEVVS